ncbi:AAA family ATPase [Singulisphaera sp. Ch08]|uniref:AAA family ATPase n=1 Tax=Singulisphaera sp. Ch08 TaxID=3120278 RepID=A0AAU7CNH2_9BACT
MSRSDLRSVIKYSAYVERATQDFTGRGWVFETINDWLALPEGPRFFLLTGAPGSGKTAIAGRLLQFAQGDVPPPEGLGALARGFVSAVHFCSDRQGGANHPLHFVQSLADQFMRTLPSAYTEGLVGNQDVPAPAVNVGQIQGGASGAQVIGVYIENLVLSSMSPEEAFHRLIWNPLASLFSRGFDRQVVVLVDGLDEARRYSGPVGIANLLARADTLPAGVRFLVTSRPDPWTLRPLQPSLPVECSLSSGHSQSQQDVEQYALHMLFKYPQLGSNLEPGYSAAECAHDVVEECGGSFLHAVSCLSELAVSGVQITRESLRGMSQTLAGFYRNLLARVAGRDEYVWLGQYQVLLGTLAVAREALTEGQLADFVGTSVLPIRRRLTNLREILTVDESLPPERRSWSLFHHSFSDFLVDSTRAGEFYCDTKHQHARFVAYYRRKLRLE